MDGSYSVKFNFRCCFCNEIIISNDIDPCDINILTNVDKSKGKQENQTFYCHIYCFAESISSKMKDFLVLDELD